MFDTRYLPLFAQASPKCAELERHIHDIETQKALSEQAAKQIERNYVDLLALHSLTDRETERAVEVRLTEAHKQQKGEWEQ